MNREAWLNAFAERAAPYFAAAGAAIPDNVRISIGFTSGGNRGKRIGEMARRFRLALSRSGL